MLKKNRHLWRPYPFQYFRYLFLYPVIQGVSSTCRRGTPKCKWTWTKAVNDRFKCTIYTIQNCDINFFWEKKDLKHFLMHSWGTQLSKAETPWGSEELQSTYQGFLDINLHGIVIIAFELFICIWHQDWDPQLCRHCDEVNIIAIL